MIVGKKKMSMHHLKILKQAIQNNETTLVGFSGSNNSLGNLLSTNVITSNNDIMKFLWFSFFIYFKFL